MVSIGQRLDVNQRTERGYWNVDSVNTSVTPPNVQKPMDTNKPAVYMKNGIKTTICKSHSGSESGPYEVCNHVAINKEDPKCPTEAPNSPEVRYRFQRNPSMTARLKKLNRRSMPVFKISAEGIIEEIDLPEKANKNHYPRSARRKMSANLSLTTSPPIDITSPPTPPRTNRSNAFNEGKFVPSHFSPSMEAAQSYVVNVRRASSFPASEASQQKPTSAVSDFRFFPERSSSSSSSSSSQSLDDANAQSVSRSPLSSPPSEPPDAEIQPKGLSRKRSHVVKRKRISLTGTGIRLAKTTVPIYSEEPELLEASSAMVLSKEDNSTMDASTDSYNPFNDQSAASFVVYPAGRQLAGSHPGGTAVLASPKPVRTQGPRTTVQQQSDKWGAQQQQQNTDIIAFEDDGDDNMSVGNFGSDHGPFNDFDALRHRPVHLAVFLNYVVDSRDPSNFLLWLAVDHYKLLSGVKDMVKTGDAIYRYYLSPAAVFKVAVDEGIARSIQSVLQSKNAAEEALRGVFDPAVQLSLNEVREQLATFRAKMDQGVGNLYGEDTLQQAMQSEQPQSDAKLVEEILSPTLQRLQQATVSEEADQFRISIKQDAVQTFMHQYGSKRSKKTSRIYSKFTKTKSHRISGSMDSIIDDSREKRLSGIGNIFKKPEKSRPKSEKPKSLQERGGRGSKREKVTRRLTLRDNAPIFIPSFYKAPKVSASRSSDQLSSIATPAAGDSGHDRPADIAEATPGVPDHQPLQAVKSAPYDEPHRTIESVPQTPLIQEPPLNTSSNSLLSNHGSDSASVDNDGALSVSSSLSRSGSIRRRNAQHDRSTNPHKSNSDPDKEKVRQAVIEHGASNSDQFDHPSRLSSLLNLDQGNDERKPEERRLFDIHALMTDPEKRTAPAVLVTPKQINIDVPEQHWSDSVPKNVLRELDRREVKRQEIIYELITTEEHHVRDLRIIEQVFYEPMLKTGLLTQEELHQAFPNLKEILLLHRELNQRLKEVKKKDGYVIQNLGDTLLAKFDGSEGTTFKNECAQYCRNQFTVLSLIKEKSKKNQQFAQLLEEAQKLAICRKLHLKDFIPMEFQRLTKYPLLLDNIIKQSKKKDEVEKSKIETCCARCRDILSFVNQTVKEAEDKQKVIEIQKNLDRDFLHKQQKGNEVIQKYKNIDLTQKSILLQGQLTWKIAQADKKKMLPMHCILYDDVMVLLLKQDDRYVLKCQEDQGKSRLPTAEKSGQSDKESGTYGPFIPMQGVYVRNVATEKRAFFVMSTFSKAAKMYEFVASSSASMREWMSVISKNAKIDIHKAVTKRAKVISIQKAPNEDNEKPEETIPAGKLIGRSEDNVPDIEPPIDFAAHTYSSSAPTDSDSSSAFVQNRIQLKEQEIIDALATKYLLLAEMSNLPAASLQDTLDMCSVDPDPDPVVLVRHLVLCADKLIGLINNSTAAENVRTRRILSDVSKRLSAGDPFPSTSSQNEDTSVESPEKWATKVSLPSQQTAQEQSPHHGSSATLNSVSDLSVGESDQVLSPSSDTGSLKRSRSNPTDRYRTGEEESIFETGPSASNSLHPPVLRRVPESLAISSVASQSQLLSDHNLSDQSSSRPSSLVDLCVSTDDFPIDKMMDIVYMLQTQLTRLMHVTDENEKQKALLVEENERLKAELQKNNDASENLSLEGTPPPSYDDSVA